ncbi:5-oxoprolinase subunit B [Hymenobacter ginsengisoli]|uniref:5-oxoprolinase subunit B n=1 Tax=Hymenobacter ginsengisoli TaxID=1051626 RepID=A0ABP8Q651_9BACT|nr:MULTISPECIES: 5-oxoprolinase subunit PxpB [unclassified Hymenobacter]MBO2030994.1 5-oxoprolinase subunit PxpB [Hymenobacter sp. BT559]
MADSLPLVRLYPLGDAAVVLELGQAIAPATHQLIQAFRKVLAQRPLPGLREVVPAFTTLTVYYDPWVLSQASEALPYEQVASYLQRLLPAAQAAATAYVPGPLVEIPVCYGGDFGPDLGLVASHAQLSPEEVIARHAQAEYLVYMVGFAPGFPYLGGLDAGLATPRRAQPRPLVPAGAVGIAGAQTGIYSLPTPGGWQLIGRTPLRLFDPGRAQPSLLQAGDRLRFVSISEVEFQRLAHVH